MTRSLMAALRQDLPEAARLLGGGLAADELLLRARMAAQALTTPAVVTAMARAQRSLPRDLAREEQLDRLAAGAVVVCAGQQPGLFGGPLMTLAKAAAAVRLAARLDAAGIPAVPLFWSAAEDHDLLEAGRYFIRPDSARAESSLFRLPRRDHDPSLDEFEFEARDREELERLVEREGAERDYLPTATETFGAWTLRILARLTAGSGLLLVSPSWFARELVPFRRRLLAGRLELAELMKEASENLRAAGFAAPLAEPDPSSSFHFLATAEGRRRLDAKPPGWTAGELEFSAEDLDRILDLEPERISSSAAARPLAQQALFPVVAQISGPTEGAYMAQLMPLFVALGLPRPLVRPRPSLLVIDRRIRELAAEAGLTGDPRSWDLAPTTPEAEPLAELEARLKTALEGVENQPDPFLRGELVGYRREVMASFRRLRKEAERERKRREKPRLRARHRLEQELRPGQGGQDRVVAPPALGLPLDGRFFERLVAGLDAEALDDLTIEIGSEDDRS